MKQLREYESELREIEKVIDLHHKNLDIFKKPYQQATIDIKNLCRPLWIQRCNP